VQEQPPTGLQVQIRCFPRWDFLLLCSPIVVIDGQAHKTSWGKQRFSAAPGEHTVKIFFKYLWMPECGANTITVTVAPGQITKIKYFMPPFIAAASSLKEVKQAERAQQHW
jgi:hypothetical protein